MNNVENKVEQEQQARTARNTANNNTVISRVTLS